MNVKELKKTKISDLSPEQVEDRIEFLLTLSDKEISEYVLYVLDKEYVLAPTESESISNDKSLQLLADPRFTKFRYSRFSNK